MKKVIFTGLLFLLTFISFAQREEENGKIYIKHPYIDVINKSTQLYLGKDFTALAALFADSAKIWYSGMDKPLPAKEVLKEWGTDSDFYDSINVKAWGYPDYLHYKDKDQKIVQSWWVWSGKSKKTGEVIKIDFVQFDMFNNDGKVEMEALYGDFSKMVKN